MTRAATPRTVGDQITTQLTGFALTTWYESGGATAIVWEPGARKMAAPPSVPVMQDWPL